MQKSGCTIPGHLSLSNTERWVCPALTGMLAGGKEWFSGSERITFLVETGNAFRICPMREI